MNLPNARNLLQQFDVLRLSYILKQKHVIGHAVFRNMVDCLAMLHLKG